MISKICILGLVLLASRVEAQFNGNTDGNFLNNPSFPSFLWPANGPTSEQLLTKADKALDSIMSMANDTRELKTVTEVKDKMVSMSDDIHQLLQVSWLMQHTIESVQWTADANMANIMTEINEMKQSMANLYGLFERGWFEMDTEGRNAFKRPLAKAHNPFPDGLGMAKDIINYSTMDNRRTPLTDAIYKRDFEHAKMLLGMQADVRQKDGNGYSPLWTAVEHGNSDLVLLCLENGANPNLKKDGITPIQWCDTKSEYVKTNTKNILKHFVDTVHYVS